MIDIYFDGWLSISSDGGQFHLKGSIRVTLDVL